MRPPITNAPSAPDVTEPPATLPVVRISEWLESIRSQASIYHQEDNGDKRHWSIYNQGRADALENVIEDVRRMLSNAELSDSRPL
jgi:hypothetical protein